MERVINNKNPRGFAHATAKLDEFWKPLRGQKAFSVFLLWSIRGIREDSWENSSCGGTPISGLSFLLSVLLLSMPRTDTFEDASLTELRLDNSRDRALCFSVSVRCDSTETPTSAL